MKRQRIMEAMTHLDDRFIEEANPAAAKPMTGLRRRVAVRWISLAACIALIIGIALFGSDGKLLPRPPVYDHAVYNAEDIAALFSATNDSVGTSSYTEVFVPTEDELHVPPVPDVEYLTVYAYKPQKLALKRTELETFVDRILDNFSKAIQTPTPQYAVKEESSSYSESRKNYLEVNATDMGAYWIGATQTYAENYFRILMREPTGKTVLNGVTVQVDQTQTDAQIISNLETVKKELFAIFGAEFSDMKIVRHYNGYSEYGVSSLEVYFYNKSESIVLSENDIIFSDYICLDFDNHQNYSGDFVSDSVLTAVSIRYVQSRQDIYKSYRATKQLKRISLSDAEKLLYNGYVFGGHSCPICMENQEKVSFEGYDYAGLVYLNGPHDQMKKEYIPFYVFYKKIGTARNGNLTYAKTYVPAIEVSGLDAYFEKQKDDHVESATVLPKWNQ